MLLEALFVDDNDDEHVSSFSLWLTDVISSAGFEDLIDLTLL